MNLYSFVFSNNSNYRIPRHVLFWLTWVVYYTIFMSMAWQRFSFAHAFLPSFLVELFSIPLDMSFCYAIIYWLIPHYLNRGKYIAMVIWWLVFSLLFIFLFRLYNMYITPAIYNAWGMQTKVSSSSYVWDFFSVFSQINMEGCLTAAIKLGKMWFVKKQELDLIKKEKQKIEPNHQEGRMQPVFLIDALERISSLSADRPEAIPSIIQKLKSLMLYVIYDYNQAQVPLEKELSLVKEYVDMEKETNRNDVQINMRLTGNPAGERIAPFIILPIIENSFRQLSLLPVADKTIDLDIRLSEGHLLLQVVWSKPTDSSTLANGGNAFLQQISRRLNLLYPQSHALKVTIKTSQFMVTLEIDLHAAIN